MKLLKNITKANRAIERRGLIIMKKFKYTLKAICIGTAIMSALTIGAVVIAKSAVQNDDMKFKVAITEDSKGTTLAEIPIGIGIRGDADGDEKVSVRDASLVARYLANATVNKNYMPEFKSSLGGAMADANNDGKLSVRDAAAIAKYLAIKDPDKSWDK